MSSPPTTPFRTNTVPINGINLSVNEYESPNSAASALILIHGIGSRYVSWYPVIDQLAAEYRVIAYDHRGHGASDHPDHGYLLPDYAADLAGLIDALNLKNPCMFGHSLGGLTALHWAASHPGDAAAIVLEDVALSGGPHLRPAFDGWIALSRLSVPEAAAWYAKEYPHWTPDECRRRAESITSVHPNVFVEMRDESTTSARPPRLLGIEDIRSPMLLVYGDPTAGSMVRPEDATRLTQLMPTLRLTHIPNVGHNIHRDATDAFLNAVSSFLPET